MEGDSHSERFPSYIYDILSHRTVAGMPPGSLPDGLQVLAFDEHSRFQHALQPGVIPASVEVVSMGRHYDLLLEAGEVPASVRRLRLPYRYTSKELSGVLSPGTCLVRWQ